MNGWACSDTVADVRERRKEFGESEVEFSRITGAMLSLFGQLLRSAVLEKSPLSFPISRILLPPPVSSLRTFSGSPPTWSSMACPCFDVGHSFAWWLPEPQTRHNLFLCLHSSSSGLSFPSNPNTLS